MAERLTSAGVLLRMIRVGVPLELAITAVRSNSQPIRPQVLRICSFCFLFQVYSVKDELPVDQVSAGLHTNNYMAQVREPIDVI